ncbi:MAG TPA: hypothetical protein VF623_05185 [Segetibacter sp.]
MNNELEVIGFETINFRTVISRRNDEAICCLNKALRQKQIEITEERTIPSLV